MGNPGYCLTPLPLALKDIVVKLSKDGTITQVSSRVAGEDAGRNNGTTAGGRLRAERRQAEAGDSAPALADKDVRARYAF